jgi:SAM-dependent methyltransferase
MIRGVPEDFYTGGAYLERNPTWHVEDSAWKVRHVRSMLTRHDLRPRTVCEVGCGAGEILRLLREELPAASEFVGYEVSPQAYELAVTRQTDRLRFELADLTTLEGVHFDLILIMDVIEHLEDYHSFLRALKDKAEHLLLHIPLDLSSLSVARPHVLKESHDALGHIHFFIVDTALQALEDSGWQVVDWFYTYSGETRPDSRAKGRLLHLSRTGLGRINTHLAVRLLGGHSLMALTR